MSDPNVRRTVTGIPRAANISENALMRSILLRFCALPSTSFTGIKFTWQSMPRNRFANSSATILKPEEQVATVINDAPDGGAQ